MIDRFWSKVDKTDGCWNWTSATDGRGYGFYWRSRKSIRAHRVSWEMANGPVPRGKIICHICDNRLCVNPSHLYAGSYADNCRDMHKRGRSQNNKGERHNLAKLTDNCVIFIRRDYSPWKVTKRYLATKYGVSVSTVKKIVEGASWKHI